jgi:hypothetical protein
MSANINKDNKFFRITQQVVKYTKPKYDILIDLYEGTSIPVRVLNVVVPGILTYVFTLTYYNLLLSIIFSLLTFFALLLYNKPLAFGYIFLYILVIIKASTTRVALLGNPLEQTNIILNGHPYSCAGHSLTVNSSWFPRDLNGGYFTYSYWLYVNGNNLDKTDNWNNYRNNEWKSIFYRGSVIDDNSQDLSKLIQFPGFWLTPIINNLVVVFQNGSYVERLEINNIEFNKWINIIVVVEMKSVSIYINGLLDRALNLYQNVSIMNNYNLYISGDKLISNDRKKSGFAGDIAYLTYYNYALNVNNITSTFNYYKKIINKYENNSDNNCNNCNKCPTPKKVNLITNNMTNNST